MTFATSLPDDSPYRPRTAIAGKDARTLAREILAMTDEEFRGAFKGSPMKRAKLRGLKRNASVVLGNVGTADDVPALVAASSDPEPLVQGHAAWALGKIGSPEALEALRATASVESHGRLIEELRSAPDPARD